MTLAHIVILLSRCIWPIDSLIHFFIGVSHGEGRQRKEAKMRYWQGVSQVGLGWL